MNRLFIKSWLVENKIYMKDFAQELGYSRVHLSNVIHGRANPSKELAEMISKRAGFDFKRVMMGEEE